MGLVRSKKVSYFSWETYALTAHGLQKFYGTVLKEIVFSCLNCFGIAQCRCSVRLHFSFHTNCVIFLSENGLCFAIFLVSCNVLVYLLPSTKKLFWSCEPFLVHWMLMDDMYICSRALPMQIASEGWGCSNQTWLKVIGIKMEKAIRSSSSHRHPQDQCRFVSNGTFLVLSRRGQCRSALTLHPTALPPSWKIRKPEFGYK